MKPTILVTGVFDLLHPGHITLLEHASGLGRVVVGVEPDVRVSTTKGPDRPFWNQEARVHQLQALDMGLEVRLLPETMAQPEVRQQLLEEIRPKVLLTSHSSPHLDAKAKMMQSLGGELVTIATHQHLSSTQLASNLRRHQELPGFELQSPQLFDPTMTQTKDQPVVYGNYLAYQADRISRLTLAPSKITWDLRAAGDQTVSGLCSLVWLLSSLSVESQPFPHSQVTRVQEYLEGRKLAP